MRYFHFVVFGKTTMKGKPAERPFDYPTFRHYLKASHTQHLIDYLQGQPKLGFDLADKVDPIKTLISYRSSINRLNRHLSLASTNKAPARSPILASVMDS